ncbi:Nuclear RNA export factor 1 [Orchesella cincta]|uniref:Nuclear RNA export factor 1 n=1 Tax=Orchesella cincta TaxID=48709 RepID=A0A1D2NL14_ORCCI|nr:Nuclear RNA export factor 1 [Orchesella cincta]
MPRYNNDGRTAKFLHTGGGGGGGGRGGRGGGFQDNKKFNDFKFTVQQNRGGIQKKHKKVFQRLDDAGDVIMGGEPQPGSSGQGGHRRNNRKNRDWKNKLGKSTKHNDFIFGPGWHKVTLIDGTSYSKDAVLSMLLATCRTPFTPIAYSVIGTNTVFFVEERAVAQSLAECNDKITVAENQTLKLRIQPCGFPPTANFDTACENKVQAELELRFQQHTMTLDLSNFLMSQGLIREYFLPLTRASVVMKIFGLLESMLNTLVGLDLSNNKLVNLEGYGILLKKTPSLRALNLGKNKFRDINVLDKLHGMQITEFILEENPVCNNYTEKDKYISTLGWALTPDYPPIFVLPDRGVRHRYPYQSRAVAPCLIAYRIMNGGPLMKLSTFKINSNQEVIGSYLHYVSLKRDLSLIVRSDVRKRFPKVTKLDGVDIPPPITFEVSEPVKMPEVRASSFCNEEAKKVVLAFWEQYVMLYDSNERQPLIQAYHETAAMSMMASYSQQGHVSQMDPSKKLSVYIGDSRNLHRQPDKHRKYKLLHQGKQDIIEFLQRLPKTTHDVASFVIDMPVAVENFILFNVIGLIKEREERNQPIRYFSRTFALVPLNGGFVIVNELLYITNPTTEQIKGAFKAAPITANAVVNVNPVPAAVQGPSTAVAALSRAPTEDEKRVMLASFSQQSGMNEDWSRKCLEQNEWDFNRSAVVYSQLKEQGKIPPEAFVK